MGPFPIPKSSLRLGMRLVFQAPCMLMFVTLLHKIYLQRVRGKLITCRKFMFVQNLFFRRDKTSIGIFHPEHFPPQFRGKIYSGCNIPIDILSLSFLTFYLTLRL